MTSGGAISVLIPPTLPAGKPLRRRTYSDLDHPHSPIERLAAFERGWWVMVAITFASLVPLVLLKRPSNL
jgi:hypothetical protein